MAVETQRTCGWKVHTWPNGVLEWKMMPPPTGHPSRRNLGSYSRNMWKPWCSLISPFQPFDVQRGPTSPVCPPFEEAFLQLGTAPSTDFSTGVSWWTWSETPKFTYQWLGFWEYVFFQENPWFLLADGRAANSEADSKGESITCANKNIDGVINDSFELQELYVCICIYQHPPMACQLLLSLFLMAKWLTNGGTFGVHDFRNQWGTVWGHWYIYIYIHVHYSPRDG